VAVADCNWFEYYLTPRPEERLVDVEHLRALNEDPVPLLCGYLRDPRLRVRTIAAWTLAEVGDERAVGPLCDALDSADRGVSPWARWLATCVGMVFAAIVTCLAVLTALFITRVLFTTDRGAGFASEWRQNLASLRGHELFVSAVVKALDRITERHPNPAARRALTPLNRLSEDTLRHQPDTRDLARRTAHRINLSTLNCHRLPLPSEASLPSVEELPVPHVGINAQ
jgi:hypothetical protein